MEKKGVYWLLMYYVSTRSIADWFDSNELYFITDAILIVIIGLFVYSKSEKTGRNLIAVAGVLALASCQALNRVLRLIDENLEIRHIDVLFTIIMIVDLVYLYRMEILNGIKCVLNKMSKATKWVLKKIKLIKK